MKKLVTASKFNFEEIYLYILIFKNEKLTLSLDN